MISAIPVRCSICWVHIFPSHQYRRGHGIESHWNPDIFQVSFFQLLKLEKLLRWSLFTFIYNPSTNMNFTYISHYLSVSLARCEVWLFFVLSFPLLFVIREFERFLHWEWAQCLCLALHRYPVGSFHGHSVPSIKSYFAPNQILINRLVPLPNYGAKSLFVVGTKWL